MDTIWKYPLQVLDQVAVSLPLGSRVLTVQEQHGKPCLWAQVDDEERITRERTFRIIGTGNPFPAQCGPLSYVGTFQLLDGDLVFHVYEEFNA